MTQRRSGKVLLEMMQTGGREPVRDPRVRSARWSMPKRVRRERPAREARAPSDEAPAWSTWFGGARSVRIPIGYLFVGAALALALTFLGYMVGYSRADGRLEAQRSEAAARGVDEVVSDPLLADLPVNPTLLAGGSAAGASERTGPAQTFGAPAQSPASTSANPSAPVVGDPREPGMNYYIVAREHAQEAERVAAFLRASGIDAMVVADSQAPWRLVVALKGFPPGMLSSSDARDYKARIQLLGQRWKAEHRGTTDFRDMYAAKHQQ